MQPMKSQDAVTLDDQDRRRLLAAEGYLTLEMAQEAEAELDAIPACKRGLPEPLGVRMMISRHLGAWATMRDAARELTALQPDEAQWWISWAYAARRAESLDRALSILQEGRARRPKEAIVHFNIACYLAQLRRLEAARGSLREAIRLDDGCRELAKHEPDLAPLRGAS